METATEEPWQAAWRVIAPHLPTRGLEALATALETDDPRLVQRSIVQPWKLLPGVWREEWDLEVAALPPTAACAVGFCGWQGENLATAGAVNEFFDQVFSKVNVPPAANAVFLEVVKAQLVFPDALRMFTHWFDHTNRAEMRVGLWGEVRRTLTLRGEACHA